jgi:Dis3-like cold-shock domain 2 (CSD2)/Rrp44-like cold shock domain
MSLLLDHQNDQHHHKRTLIVPQAMVLRKYLPLLVRLVTLQQQQQPPPPPTEHQPEDDSSSPLYQQQQQQYWIILESCIDYLDWRNQVGMEKAAPVERQRLQGILADHYYLPDASWILVPVVAASATATGSNNAHDEWDVWGYAKMTERERCQHSLVRAVNWLLAALSTTDTTTTTTTEIWVVVDDSDDEEYSRYDLEDPRAKYVTVDELLATTTTMTTIGTTSADTTASSDREALLDLKRSCEQEYIKRNAAKAISKNQDITSDAASRLDDDDDDWSDASLQAGLKAGTLLRGRFNVSKDNVAEGYVTVTAAQQAQQTTYFIDKRHFARAFHQDVVILQVLPVEQWGRPVGRRRLVHQRDHHHSNNNNNSNDDDDDVVDNTSNSNNDPNVDPVPSARIVGIHAIGRRLFAATLLDTPPTDANAVLVVPMDMRIPKIRIKTKTWHRFTGMRIQVQITDWEIDSHYPHGQCTAILGPIGELETEIKALLVENQVELEPFTVSALSCLPVHGAHWRVQDQDLIGRRDMRTSRRIFSVDPPGTYKIVIV